MYTIRVNALRHDTVLALVRGPWKDPQGTGTPKRAYGGRMTVAGDL